MHPRSIAVLLILTAALAAGCPRYTAKQPPPTIPPGADEITLLADPALKAAFEGMALHLAENCDAVLEVEYVERGGLEALLAERIAEGSGIPQLVVVDDAKMATALRDSGAIDADSLRTFAGDRIVIAHKAGENWTTPGLYELHSLGFKQLAMGSQDTAAGYYGRQALISEGVYDGLRERIFEYPDSAAVISALLDGDAELAVVLASAATQQTAFSVMLVAAADLHEDIRYQVAATTGHANDEGVQDLLKCLAEDPAVQEVFTGLGYVPRAGALEEQR
jgi:ABC-type molybdate transport system substrate-binding protein